MPHYPVLNFQLNWRRPFLQNDVLQAVDIEGGAILVLLDLSAAFDTIDHQKLSNLLNQSFGIKGVALKWFESYLKDLTQTVQIGSCTSPPVTSKYGVLYMALSYLLCTQPLLGISFEIMGWTLIFTLAILSCIFPSNQVYQYQRR